MDVIQDAVGVAALGYGVARFGTRVAVLSGEQFISQGSRAYVKGNPHLSLFSRHKTAYKGLGNQIAEDVSIVPQHKFDLWHNYLTKRGVKFEIGSSKAIQELAQSNADGLFTSNLVCRENNILDRVIYLPEKYRARVFYEESLHALDSIKGRPRFMNVDGVDINAYEYRAKNILINSAEKRGFSYDDLVTLENHLKLVMKNEY